MPKNMKLARRIRGQKIYIIYFINPISDFQIKVERRKGKSRVISQSFTSHRTVKVKVIKMVKTLRSLTLLRVNELKREDRGFQIPEDIPQEIVKDLMIADFFNGVFTNRTRKVSVMYDGVTWTLSANTLASSYLGIQPFMEMNKFRMQNTTVEAGAHSPLINLDSLLEMTKNSQDLIPEDLEMKMEIKFNAENWGRLEVIGPDSKFVWTINSNLEGSRTLTHHGVRKIDSETNGREFSITSLHLEETSEGMDET